MDKHYSSYTYNVEKLVKRVFISPTFSTLTSLSSFSLNLSSFSIAKDDKFLITFYGSRKATQICCSTYIEWNTQGRNYWILNVLQQNKCLNMAIILENFLKFFSFVQILFVNDVVIINCLFL